MIPYFELRRIPLSEDLSLAVFGLCVMAGVAAGALFAQRRAITLGFPQEEMAGAIVWAVIPGFLVAHVVEMLLYQPAAAFLDLRSLLAFWDGMSSFGGFLGAVLGLAIYFRGRRGGWVVHAEILLQALVVGWLFGRLGCTLVHDHVGRRSDFVLAIQFPGGARHDLGFYELLYTALVLLPAVLILNRKPRRPGTTIFVTSLLYAPARFLGDFLRNTDLPGADPRYLSLTPAQYGCMLLAGISLYFGWRVRKGVAVRG